MKIVHSSFPFYLIGVAFSLFFLSACKDDSPNDPSGMVPSVAGHVLFLNEGGFQKGNASISVWNTENSEVSHDLFQKVNRQPIGDVLNSLSVIDGNYWFVVNNSGKIWVTDTSSLEVQHEVTGFTSPRHVLKVAENKAYVTDLFSGFVSIVDVREHKITGNIKLPGWTEQMMLAAGKVWVSNKASKYIYAIDPQTDAVTDSLPVRKNGGQLFPSFSGERMLLFCEAEWDLSTRACVYVLDPQSVSVVDSLEFNEGQYVSKVFRSPKKDAMFYIADSKLYQTTTGNPELVSDPLIDLSGMTIYGVGINPGNEDIYLSDALDFTNRSDVHIYRPDGTHQKTIKAGVNCNGFHF